MNDNGPLLYVGTYTWRDSQGIYAFRMDPATGALEPTGRPTQMDNPSFLATDPAGRYLYAVGESDPEGTVAAFRIDPQTGGLTPINRQSSRGSSPCHLCVDPTGRCVIAANYGSGSVTVLPVRDDGGLEGASWVVQHEGSGPDPGRQEGPHAHSVTLSPDGRRLFAADLGCDKVFSYQLDVSTGTLLPGEVPWVALHPGAGPRHFAFHPNGTLAYVINELDSTLTGLRYCRETGALTTLQTVSTLPPGYSEDNWPADVHVHPSGRFVYGSNRGHDSLGIWRVDRDTGALSAVGHQPTGGRNPRNFAIAPGGQFVLVANQDTDDIVTFRMDGQTGRLEETSRVTGVPMPVCLCFVPAGGSS